MEPLFQSHALNDQGQAKTKRVREAFSRLLQEVLEACGPSGREVAIVKTRLEEACFYAIRAVSSRTENQEPP